MERLDATPGNRTLIGDAHDQSNLTATAAAGHDDGYYCFVFVFVSRLCRRGLKMMVTEGQS